MQPQDMPPFIATLKDRSTLGVHSPT